MRLFAENSLIGFQDDCRNSLEALEKLLNEFFSPGTSNERQRELENILSTFSGRPESWRLCLQFLTLTSNQYVAMYCLATIEVSRPTHSA